MIDNWSIISNDNIWFLSSVTMTGKPHWDLVFYAITNRFNFRTILNCLIESIMLRGLNKLWLVNTEYWIYEFLNEIYDMC